MRIEMRLVAAVCGLVVVGTVGLMAWSWLDGQRSQRAMAAYRANNRAHLARVLEELAVLPDALRESSGLAVSRRQPGVLWSHNDSGDGPNLYAIDLSGRLLATIPVANAAARDWEDIASGPCPRLEPAVTRSQRPPSSRAIEANAVAASCMNSASIEPGG